MKLVRGVGGLLAALDGGDGDGAAGLVAHVLALADGAVVGVTDEGLARGVEVTALYLALHVLGGGELQALDGGEDVDFVGALVGVAALALGDVDDGEGAEALDGDAGVLLFAQEVAHLVEDGWDDGKAGGLADAAAADDAGGELGEECLGLHDVD